MNQESGKNASQKKTVAEREKETLAFWKKHEIFEKTLRKKSPRGEFVFYDGPPFASGVPHYGHILAGTIKDAIPRYKTMKGYHVRRRWGWDCHGLPVENLIEKELDLKTKKEIEEYGIGRFNEAAGKSVLRYTDEWREIVPRTGRWADMEDDYRTMDASYTESVWWVFKTLYDKGLIYEGFKSMHLCPRCETTLSNFEVSQGYADITDLAVTVKLPLLGETDTFLLVWTTTPWTLPGNMAAAVNKDFDYVKIRITNDESRIKEKYIVAKERAPHIFGEQKYEIVEGIKGSKLVGKRYEPPFGYYKNAALPHKENAWKIYHAPYVKTDEGTGIVHLAPAFGEEDLALAEKENIPIVHHVGRDGTFKEEVRDFAGMPVKPKEDHQKTDIEIIKYLAAQNLLFKKEKIIHAYPLCWRCETPLLNYAANSWFVAVTKIKDALVAANEKIHWVPKEVGEGRFGNWLANARDWAISRTRYWGAPLPVWKNARTGKLFVAGSVADLRKRAKKSGNTYLLMRHGEADNNVLRVVSSAHPNNHHLTEKGRMQAKEAAEKLKGRKIDVIVSSPLARAKETTDILAETIGFDAKKILFDMRLTETDFGAFEGKPTDEYHKHFPREKRFENAPGETLADQKKRMTAVLYELEEKYQGKTILLVSHSDPLWMLCCGAYGLTREESFGEREPDCSFMDNAEVRELPFAPLPHDEEFTLNLHRPYIDTFTLLDDDGAPLKRIPDVFDCWFESGAMPYGENHYPFNLVQDKPSEDTRAFNPKKNKGFPADFIAEGLDQTRGWFYSLLVLGVALFGKASYKNVIVNGLILAEDGRKMSKRLKNCPDPVEVIEKYGADALRFYLLSSPVLRADDLNFSEKGVNEVQNKMVLRAENVLAFYEMYPEIPVPSPHSPEPSPQRPAPSAHVLDQWIAARVKVLCETASFHIERYELDRAMRPIAEFLDDFSTWYLRRSRERLKSENPDERTAARATLQETLLVFSKIIAPFMPFLAEDLYRHAGGEKESVHLEEWPEHGGAKSVSGIAAFLSRLFGGSREKYILSDMKKVRDIVSQALLARAKEGIKVRQPLKELRIKNKELRIKENDELVALIKDEVNVKEVIFGALIEEEVALDTVITPALKEEGMVRDIVRSIQDLRKENGLSPQDRAALLVGTNEEGKMFMGKNKRVLEEATTTKIEFTEQGDGQEVLIGEMRFKIEIRSKEKS